MGKLIILTGAGLSAESGIPTFRDKNGLWGNHRIEEVCDIRTWRQNFDLVHRFYNERRTKLGTAHPNAAHRQIAKWEALYQTVIITQNIDDLLERGGCKRINHLHGFLTEMQCQACGNQWSIGYSEWTKTDCCPTEECRSFGEVKPNVVFFGEQAPLYRMLFRTLEELEPDDVFLVIGTTGVVLPINCMARNANCIRILNNLGREEEINGRNFDYVFYERATQAIPKIDSLLQAILGKR